MNNQLPTINAQTIQIALAVFISNLVTGNVAHIPYLAPIIAADTSGLFQILSVMVSTVAATGIIGFYTRVSAQVEHVATTPGVSEIVVNNKDDAASITAKNVTAK